MKTKLYKWNCVNKCGACCKLEPSDRSDAINVLAKDQLKAYMSMVGDDGWCKFYDKVNRMCLDYNNRPDFCHVKNIAKLFNIPDKDHNKFAIMCCKQQIRTKFGGRSKEMKNFVSNIIKIES